jgi:signal transduction histidine kinase
MSPARSDSTEAAEPAGPQAGQAAQLLALRDAVLAISADLSLSETLRRIIVAAARLAGARYGALGVPDATGEFLAEFVTTGLAAEQEARIGHRPRGHGILGVLLREGQSLRLRDLGSHPQSAGFPPHHPPMRSFLGVPIVHKGRTIGSLYLTDKLDADEFSPDDQHLIELLAAHAGIAIENARLYQQVQQLRVVEERQRIGMDLHDGIIQSIYAVGLTLEVASGQLADGEPAGAAERLRGAIEALSATIRDIRSYILDLRPRRFEGDDLVAGLQQLLGEFKANTLMAVDFSADPGADRALSPEARRALFHIAQEALSNAAKHSRASRVEVFLSDSGREVQLVLRDNGRGFDPERVARHAGHGLLNMRERAEALGGRLELIQPASGGSEIRVTVPYGHEGGRRA